MENINKGKIIQILGAVIDVEFPSGKLPMVKDALTVELDGRTKVMEVPQHMGGSVVRAIMLSASDGLCKGMELSLIHI